MTGNCKLSKRFHQKCQTIIATLVVGDFTNDHYAKHYIK